MDLARDAPARTFLASPARVVANAQVTPEHCRYFVEARDGSFASFEEVLLLRADPEVFDALAIGLWYDGPQNAVAGEGCLIL